MKKDLTTYAAIFQDGTFVEKETFEEILLLSTAYIILKIEFLNEGTTERNQIIRFYSLKPINREGKPVTIKNELFEIIDIGPICDSGFYHDGVQLKILELKTNTIHTFITKANGLSIFKNNVFPMLKKLDEFGSWSSYEMYKNCNTLEQTNEKYLQKIKKLEQKIKDLQDENAELKNLKSN